MYLENISLIYMSPCVADDTKIRFKAELSCSIKELMPYLNAVIKHATFNPKTNTMFFTQGVRMITLTDRGLAVARASDLTDAHKIMDFIKDKVNEVHNNKNGITPVYDKRVNITALDIFSYLPKSNCKKCGEPGCLAFAVKLLLAEQKLPACEPLATDIKYKEHKKELEELALALGI